MALVVLLKGVNVGGHRTFRPSVLAKELARFDVVNLGAAGTFVVRSPASRATLRAEIQRRLPFQVHVMIFPGTDILRLAASDPLGLYRRQMKAIGYLDRLEKMIGAPLTTRSWNTIQAIARVLGS